MKYCKCLKKPISQIGKTNVDMGDVRMYYCTLENHGGIYYHLGLGEGNFISNKFLYPLTEKEFKEWFVEIDEKKFHEELVFKQFDL